MRKRIAGFLVFMMVLTAVLSGKSVTVSAEDITADILTWDGLCACFLDLSGQHANKLVLANDIEAKGSFERAILPENMSLTLDLNGHSINGAAQELKDFDIQGNLQIINSQPEVSTITNFPNYAIWVSESGSVTINDGIRICGNSGAAAVYSKGSFIMNGGEISANTVIDDDEHPVGAAVAIDGAGTLTLKGNPVFSDNKVNHKDGSTYSCDVMLLSKDSKIVLTEGFDPGTTPIGVAARADMTVTKGWSDFNNGKDPADFFKAVKRNASIALDEASGELMYKAGAAKQKATNTMSVKAKAYTVKYKALKKKAQTIAGKKVLTVSNAKGKVSYKLAGVTKSKYKKYFSVNSSKGNITIKKGLKKGTYKVKIKVTAAGNSDYKSSAITKTVTIKVK